ncbi:hypothetical protein HDU67_006050 [Dinochytrium kinnereticum]|nr:hypothetical protein HDU67_006050 [Dinochytrium kinnereticum]
MPSSQEIKELDPLCKLNGQITVHATGVRKRFGLREVKDGLNDMSNRWEAQVGFVQNVPWSSKPKPLESASPDDAHIPNYF